MSRLFPELDGAGPVRPPARSGENARVQVETHGHWEGNDECVRAFTAAFRLPVPFRAVRLLADGSIRMELASAGDGRDSIFLVEPTALHWRRGPGFAIAFSGKQMPRSFHAPLLKFLIRYQNTSLQAFAGRIRALAEVPSHPVVAAAGDANAEDDPLRLPEDIDHALFRSYGTAAAWRTFFEDHDLYRGSCTRLRGNVVRVMHRDIECESSYAPENVWGMGTFAGLETEAEHESDLTAEVDHDTLTLDTHLGDRDVVLGGDARLDAALNAIAAMPHRPDLVLLNSTCISVVTGDDLEASAERARRKHGLAVTSLGCVEHPVQDSVLSQLATVERRPVTRAAVLLGAPRIAGMQSVLSTLRAAGVEIEGPMLPDLPEGFVDALGRTSLFVVYDQPYTRQSVRQLLEQFPDATVLAPPPPFGYEATREFCFDVAAACGVEEEMQRVWNARYAPLEPEWRTLAARAARYRVTFVSDQPNWQARLWTRLGVPLFETLRAMRFGIEVFAFTPASGSVAETSDPGVRVRCFTNEEELTALLAESDAALVYSEVRYDRRVTRSGHASFSLEDFRCGIEGSFGTLDALVRRCELPWFRRHGLLAAAVEAPARGDR